MGRVSIVQWRMIVNKSGIMWSEYVNIILKFYRKERIIYIIGMSMCSSSPIIFNSTYPKNSSIPTKSHNEVNFHMKQ